MMRFAGKALKGLLKKGFAPDPSQGVVKQVLGRVAPDVFFGGVAAMQTPGDLADKVIAGGTQAIGGALGGGIATGTTRSLGLNLGGSQEFIGGYGGDMLGFMAGENLMRAKDKLTGGEGLTPYERMSASQQAEFAKQLEQQILMQYGLLPGANRGVIRDQLLVGGVPMGTQMQGVDGLS